jgi:hypothetical protein
MIAKVRNTVNIWKIFNLSLSGKIMIIKSLVFPIVNYFLTILPPPAAWLNEFESIITDFALNRMNISRDKCFMDPKEGGLGLFRPEIFFKSLTCSWIKRCSSLVHDNWRRIIVGSVGAGSLHAIYPNNVTDCGPIIKNIVKNFSELRDSFGISFNNYIFSPIINNEFFFLKERGLKVQYTNEIFGIDNKNMMSRHISWSDLADTGTGCLLSINQLNTTLGTNIAAVNYNKLLFGYRTARAKYEDKNAASMKFSDFFMRKFKGSKTFRKFFEIGHTKKHGTSRLTPAHRFLSISGIDSSRAISIDHINALWTTYFYQSDLKTFLFKAHHNILGLNHRVHHINQLREPTCTFSTKAKNFPAERKTFIHLFWHCPSVNKLIKRFFDTYIDGNVDLQFFFTGCYQINNRYELSVLVLIIFNVLRYAVWNFKLRKKLPSWHGLNSEFLYCFDTILNVSRKFNAAVSKCKWLKNERN